ncbi:MAG: Cna B-type domain-containing protein [Longicatena caecimuris]|uniref:Cna B-type domain-containing protein n=1 Tax=Longicatena caecimuris TaxID=1796635 RepID=UPI003992EFBE
MKKIIRSSSWKDLPKYESGKEIEYTIKELYTISGYESKIESDKDGNFILTNTHAVELINKTVAKIWNDSNNQDGIRPNEVKVQLLANGKAFGEVLTMNEKSNWSASWKDLPKYESGKEIKYTIKELDTISGYESKIESDKDGNFILTNTHAVELINKTVAKIWNDSNNQDGIRPNEVKVQLLANGKAFGEVLTLNEKNNWSASWKYLPKYESGKEINYSIKEVTISDGYTSKTEIDKNGDFIITNTHVPESPITPEKPDEPTKPKDEYTPSNNKAPQTGDFTNVSLYLVFVSTSIIAMSLIFVKKRKLKMK